MGKIVSSWRYRVFCMNQIWKRRFFGIDVESVEVMI
jgi:hypothetical protein